MTTSTATPASSAPTDALLSLEGVSKIYGDLHALDNVSLEIPRGQWVSIVGPSGSGKTTLMNIVGAMDTATKGTVMLGLIGGILGAGAGYGLAVLISTSVFHRSISLHPVILLGTVACSILIAVLACLPPVRRALAVDPALVLRGE